MPAWNAKWISYAYDPRQDLGVFAFRRTFRASGDGERQVRVSADNRYKLFCNGRLVGLGPQRGDERHWFYETYDLSPYVIEGDNELVALVWNFGWMAPMAQHTVRTGFVCEELPLSAMDVRGEGVGGWGISTPGDWQVAKVPGWDFDMMHNGVGEFYIDVGPGEIARGIDGSSIGSTGVPPVEDRDIFIDVERLDWRRPNVICTAEDRGSNGGGTPWMLIPSTLPPQRYSPSPRMPSCRGEGAGGRGTRLYDFGELLCAYPRIRASGPAGTELRVTYAESLWVPGTNDKGNRNEVEGKEIRGYQDRFILSGGEDVFEPLWWRTFRFIEVQASSGLDVSSRFEPSEPPEDSHRGLDVSSKLGSTELLPNSDETSEPLAVVTLPNSDETSEPGATGPLPNSDGTSEPPAVVTLTNSDGTSEPRADEPQVRIELQAIETGYPYAVESSFEADDPWVRPIWDVAVRTAQRCAGETYFDCPYYEQLQYVGDSRIQALIGYYLGRDRRLQRNCIDQIGWSIMENGLTQSRYPSRQTQIIPPFSLWWVMMVTDQILYDVVEPDKRLLTCAQDGIDAWSRIWIENADKFWCFGDWVQGWRWGVPPRESDSAEHYLTYVLARFALERAGMTSFDDEFWFKDRPKFLEAFQSVGGLLAMDGRPAHFSEHIEALYRLSETYLKRDHQPWPAEALERANASKCTYYFSYYKHLAMFGAPEDGVRSNRSNRSHTTYMDELQPWKEQIEAGLTTFAENPEPTRSDCHAWSAHPILGFFQIVAGVTSIAPAWQKARVMPHPGNLRRFDARIAHPDGELQVTFEDGRLEVDSPVPFELKWQGKAQELRPGRHTL